MFKQALAKMSNAFRTPLAWRYLGLCNRVWRYIPAESRSSTLARCYGDHVQRYVRRVKRRDQSFGTFFLRNRPELELLLGLLTKMKGERAVKLAVLACSKGAEVYSISFTIRSKCPELKVSINALDISKEVLEFARAGCYSIENSASGIDQIVPPADSSRDLLSKTWQGQNRSIFERLTTAEMEAMFDRTGDCATVKPQFREGIGWHSGDAGSPEVMQALGLQDVVFANRFLCHMDPPQAESCLRSLVRLVKPGGYLFVFGVDLDVRTKVARELGWTPVREHIAEIHEGDPSLRRDWPFEYWGLEPLNPKHKDWELRYASVFQIGRAEEVRVLPTPHEIVHAQR